MLDKLRYNLIKPRCCKYCGRELVSLTTTERQVFDVHTCKLIREKIEVTIKCPAVDFDCGPFGDSCGWNDHDHYRWTEWYEVL